MQVTLRCPDGSGPYTTLSPRQRLSASPYALYAPSAGAAKNLTCSGCVTATDLANGAVTSNQIAAGTIQPFNLGFTPGTVTSITAGAGLFPGTITTSGTIAVDIGTTAGTVAAGDHTHDSTYWKLDGNAGTAVGKSSFLGTTDNAPLELYVHHTRALQLSPGTTSSLIGGWPGNRPFDNAMGVVIAGGGAADDGRGNSAGNSVADNYDVVGGGIQNLAGSLDGDPSDGEYATIAGGIGNRAAATAASVGGGFSNSSTGAYGVVGGGRENTASADSATIGGGFGNHADAAYATIGGGGRANINDPSTANRVTDNYGTVGGGQNNQAGDADMDQSNAFGATVGGGGGNTAGAQGATVGGGGGNQATALYATVAGGVFNSATADHATVPGGSANIASAPGSFAAGRLALASHDGSFVWGDGSNFAASQGVRSFSALATGGFYFYYDNAGHFCRLNSTAGWLCPLPSDRDTKTNFATVDERDVLARLAAVPVEAWSYKGEDASVRHIGPMAQDFHAAFNVGEDDTHINPVDANGVALAAIQGLHQMMQEKDAEIAALKASLADLHARVTALDRAATAQGAALAGGGRPAGGGK